MVNPLLPARKEVTKIVADRETHQVAGHNYVRQATEYDWRAGACRNEGAYPGRHCSGHPSHPTYCEGIGEAVKKLISATTQAAIPVQRHERSAVNGV